MTNQSLYTGLNDAREIAQELHNLLHDDAIHRLLLYKEHSRDSDTGKWTPDLYLRCQLIEELCRKLKSLN